MKQENTSGISPASQSHFDAVQYRLIKLSLLAAIPFFVLFTLGFGILGDMIPPYDGSYPIDNLHNNFIDNALQYRIGFAISMAAAAFFMPWSVGIFAIMRRVEGGQYGVLSYTQLMGGCLTVVAIMCASWCWLTAAYRPEEMPPEIIRMLYDMGWMIIDVGFMVTSLQYIAIGVLFLLDPRPARLVPKWVCWLGFWCALEFLLALIMPNFRSGPFSWSGLFNFWLVFTVPFNFVIILTFYLLRATDHIKDEDGVSSVA